MKKSRNSVDLPIQTREAQIVPASIDMAARTVDLVWSTGAAVRRYDWWEGEYYDETLNLAPAAVDLSRLNAGAPLLNSHQAYDLSDIIGVVVGGTASVDGSQGTATVRFSKRDDVEPIWQDVQDGIIGAISVGYAVRKYTIIEEDGQVTQYRADDWMPLELSLVAIPADAGAGVRGHSPADPAKSGRAFPCALIRSNQTQETDMTKVKTPEEIAEETRLAAETETRNQATQAEAQRLAEEAAAKKKPTTAELRTLGLALRVDNVDAFIVRHIESGKTMKEIRTAEIDAAAEKQRAAQPVSGIVITRDALDTKREGMAEYLLHRVNPGQVKLDKGLEFRGSSFLDLARECLTDAGINFRGMSRMEIATHALNLHRVGGMNMTRAIGEGVSDLPNIVLNASNKTLRKAYDEANQTFKKFARQATATDFKTINRIQMSGAPNLLAVTENGEIKRGYVTDSKESYSLSTFARIIPLPRQVIINDDMDAIGRLPMAMGMAAARLESDTVYIQLISNPNMADGNAVFSSAHANYTSSGTAISVASLGVGVSAMGIQTGLAGELLNLTPDILLAPKAKDLLARQFTSNAYQPTAQSTINPYSYLTPITEGRLDLGVNGANASTTGWYLICSNGQVDTVEYSYLEGQEGAYMESRLGWEVDGMEMKVRLDIAAKVIDYRGMYFNAGA